MNRPPPYFPQNSLSPKDENKYRKFKIIVGAGITAVLLITAGIAVGLYYLVSWFLSGG